jgi:hypothetical protein
MAEESGVAADTTAMLRLAGLALAHAAWSVEGGETLCTMAMVERDGGRELVRYEAPTIDESVEAARADLREHLADGGCAALVVDGYATREGGERTDALLVELFGPAREPMGMIIQPYRAARRSRIPFIGRASGFEILGEPTLSGDLEVDDADRIVLAAAREHPQAGRLFPE